MKGKTEYTALVILNYNNYEDTFNCIESVEKYNTSPVKIIIVDNGSRREGTVETIDRFLNERYAERYQRIDEHSELTELPYMTFVVSKTNDGYACGNNKGLKFVTCDETINRVLILNNDVLFVEDIIGKLIDYQESLPQCAIISPALYKKGMKEYDLNCARLNQESWDLILTYLFNFRNVFGVIKRSEHRRYLLLKEHDKKSLLEVELPSGSCMMFRKELMKRITIFDPHTFLYFEENILFKQISKVGLKNYVAMDLKCIHLGASSTSKSSNTFIARVGVKSMDYYFKTYCNLTFTQRIMWKIAKINFSFKLFIQDKLK